MLHTFYVELNLSKGLQELQSAIQRLGIPPNPPNITLFQEAASPGKGQGLFAKIKIPKGTPLLAEKPLFAVVGGVVEDRFKKLPEFLALSCPFRTATFKRRFDANSFEMSDDQRGIFVTASRFNHSCLPNAYFAWNPERNRQTVNAAVDISAGDEIFINYLYEESFEPSDERRNAFNQYEFVCTCPACLSGTEFGRASEDRRAITKTLDDEISQDTTTKDERIFKIKRLGLLLHREGLVYPQQADLYRNQASWYIEELNANQRETDNEYKGRCRRNALQSARHQLDLDIMCNGHDSPVVRETLAFIRGI